MREVNSRSLNDAAANGFTNSWTLTHPSTDSSVQFPFGDQLSDAADIAKGYGYEEAKQSGCAPPKQ